jgi:acyl carrier protein
MNTEDIRSKAGVLVKRVYETSQKEPLPENFVLLGDDGVLDSISVLELVVAIEREFGIEVTGEDVRPENFKDMPSLTQFIFHRISRV